MPKRYTIPLMMIMLWATNPTLAQVGDVYGVHDPTVVRCGSHYYLFCTGKGIPIRRSPDLIHWKHVGRVFDTNAPEWAVKEIPKTNDVWAPDITCHDGKYFLYYSVSTFGSQRSCIGLAVNKTLDPHNPNYNWDDKGKVIESFSGKDNFNAIDASVIADEKGQRWLVFGSFWSGIKLARLNNQTGMLAESKPKLYSIACRPQHHAIEAADIIFRNGYYYLFVSFDQCCKGTASTYKTMIGRAEKVTGPYLDYTGKPMMEGAATLLLKGHGQCYGPGHNDVITAHNKDWLVHHYYDGSADGKPRLQIRPLLWNEDGWPIAGEPVGETLPSGKLIKRQELIGIWQHSVNYHEPNLLTFLPDGKLNELTGKASWKFRNQVLTINWPRTDAPGGTWIDTCRVGPGGEYYIGRNQNGYVIRGIKRISAED